MIEEFTLSQVAHNYGGTIVHPDCSFSSVSTDSRVVENGQIFVALKGKKFDGHEFISSVSKKVCGLVVEKPLLDLEISQWVVPNTTWALGQIAKANRDKFNGCLIAVTGSCGKTSVKEMIASILKKIGSVLVTKDNSNNEIGVPTTLINISAAHNYAVVEMGARNAGDINYLCEIAKPDIALINNILPAHLKGFGDIQNIAKAKGEIYRDLRNNGTAVINIDEPYAQVWIKSTNAKVITFSTHDIRADFSAQNITSKKEGYFNFSLVTPQGTIQINLPLRGKHNIANAVASAACAHTAGAQLQTIQNGLNNLTQVEGRMECTKLSSDLFLIDDSYNASPGSVKAAIDTLIEINGVSILVLGDMAELGQDEIQLHADIGKYAFDAGVDIFLAVGPLSFYAAKEFAVKSQHFNEKKELLNYLDDSKILNEDLPDIKKVILVKGSRFMGMEDISDSIKNQGAI